MQRAGSFAEFLRTKKFKLLRSLSVKSKLLKKKGIVLLLFLFGYNNLYAIGGGGSCTSRESGQYLDSLYSKKICNEKSKTIEQRLSSKHSFLYVKIPELGDEYLEYINEEAARNLEPDERKERAIPIHIEFGESLLNPLKEDYMNYQVSSKIKERIIAEDSTITKKNCTFMALGSEYLFPVQAGEGTISSILYFNYARDMVGYSDYKRYIRSSTFKTFPIGENNSQLMQQEDYFSQFIHRGLRTEVNFKPGRIYQLEISINPNSAISRKFYSAFHAPFQRIDTNRPRLHHFTQRTTG